MTKNHFVTLGLQPGCTEDEVKKAYRSLARKFHPDKNKDAGAEEKFKEIAGAYEVLINQDRREIHEREVNRPKHTDTTGFKKNEPSASKYEEHSSWSKKFGKESENAENRYKNSTFGSFADEGRHPAGHKYEKKTNTKPKKKQSTRSRPRRPWSHEWTEYDTSDQFYDIPEPRPRKTNFSFAFKSFVDDLGVSFDAFFTGHEMPGVFEFSAFFDGPDPFDSFFRKGTPSSMNTGRSQAPPHKRDVAPEAGAEGIDEEYLFTSRSSQPEHPSKFTDYDVGGKTFDSDDDMDSRLFKCTYCHKRMKFSQLSTHEPGCALRHGGRFDVDDDEQDGKMNDDDIFDGTGSPEEDQYPQKTGDWRQTHEELLRNIRRAKQAARSSQRRYSSSANTGTAKETKDEGIAQKRCQWCGRSFSHPAAKQHIPFCEKWTKDHGTPLNPAGKGPARDIGSKNQKARQYAKNIPRPRGHSSEGYDSDSPRTSRSHFDSYPNVGGLKSREKEDKPGASSGTGLHASYSPREKSSSPGPGLNTSGSSGGFGGVSGFRTTPPGGAQTGRSSPGSGLNGSQAHTARGRTTTRTTGAKTKPKHTAFTDESPTYTSRFDDSYGFGLSGSRVKPETRPREHNCPICKKRYGLHGRFTCTCGVRKTGS